MVTLATSVAARAPDAVVQSETYVGIIKSYNERRGFGFVSCADSANKYGRDVYIAKAEAQFATAEGFATRHGASILAEEDFISFRVKVNADGQPQAEQVRRLRKFQGVVVQPPSLPCVNLEVAVPGRVVSEEFRLASGQPEVLVDRNACGQTMLATGDVVSFCCPDVGPCNGSRLPLARQAVLAYRPPQNVGLILGCFCISLPRLPAWEGGAARPDLRLDGHALEDRVILAGLPLDVDEGELMRFFSKYGAIGAAIARSGSGAGFAAVAFQNLGDVARLVAGGAHTFAEDQDKRTTKVLPPQVGAGVHAASRLPALPVPSLSGLEAQGSLLATWAPVVLAAGYVVEMRPAGVQAAWSEVQGQANGAFGRDASSCKIYGLPANVVFEVRVTYFTACGCRSEPSLPSNWCIACPMAVPVANPENPQPASVARGQCGPPGVHVPVNRSMPSTWQAAPPPSMAVASTYASGMLAPMLQPYVPAGAMDLQMMPESMMGMTPWSAGATAAAFHMAAPQQLAQVQQPPMWQPQQQQQQQSSWRCVHGYVNPPPSAPEVQFGSDDCCSVLVRWPSVSHATAYVVELRGERQTERFVRRVPVSTPGSLVELSIGGLHSTAQFHGAQVRCIAACGCESEPSPMGFLQMMTSVAPVQPPPPPLVAAPVPTPPADFPHWYGGRTTSSDEHKQLCKDVAEVYRQPPTCTKDAQALPSLLGSTRQSPFPSPSSMKLSRRAEKPLPLAEHEDEEECIFLD